MSPAQSVKTCMRKYVVWEGRASRSEFWWFQLVFVALEGVAALLVAVDARFVVLYVALLVLVLPSLAVTVRRLHDTGRSGGYYWLSLIPIVGPIVLLVFLAGNGSAGPNAYGEPPA